MLRVLHPAALGRPKLERDLFIGNQWRPSSTGDSIGLVNPVTEQPFGLAAAASADDVDAAVQAARAAFDAGPWPRLSIQERAAALLCFADALEADIEPRRPARNFRVEAGRAGLHPSPGVPRQPKGKQADDVR